MIITVLSIISFCFSFLIYSWIIPIFKRYFLDIPNKRSSHFKAKPTGGGIVFIFMALISSIFTHNFMPIILIPLALISLVDDYKGVRASIRFAFQLITSILIIINNNVFYKLNLENNFESLIIALFIIIFSTALINFINFMDGIDGLVTLSFIIIFGFTFYNYPSYYPFLFSLLAFLIFNWYPSKLFMGDCGSTFIACIFLDIFYKTVPQFESINLIILILPFLIDPIYTLIKRFSLGKKIFIAHNDHLYQRLFKKGLKHSSVSLIYAFFTLYLIISSKYIPNNLILINFAPIFITGYFLNKLAYPLESDIDLN